MTRILDILNSPWAILPDRLDQICDIYENHKRREKVDLAEIEAQLGRPLNNVRKNYEVVNGVAVVPIDGVVEKTMSGFQKVSGGVSTTYVQAQIQQALSDPAVNSIILQIDSPGGTVDGTRELANFIYASRGQKPITAYADGLMASAAYWIGAAADKIILADDTTQVGSIGVVATHVDQSGYNEKNGVKVTEVTAGKMKRVTSTHAPLSDAGKSVIQETVDQIYNIFTADLAKFRNAPEGTFRNTEARVYMGGKAIEAGLADGVSSLSDLVASMSKPKPVAGFHNEAGAASATTTTTKEKGMNKLNLKTLGALTEDQESEISALIDKSATDAKAAAESSFSSKLDEAKKVGADAERARIEGVLETGLPGHDALVKKLAFDGKTTPAEAALAVNQAERAAQKGHLEGMREDGKISLPAATEIHSEPRASEPQGEGVTDEALKKAWDADKNLRAEFGDDFNAFAAYKEHEAKGSIRLFSRAKQA